MKCMFNWCSSPSLAVLLLFLGMSPGRAAQISARQAETAVTRWLQRSPAPMGTPLGSTVLASAALPDETGVPLGHVVHLRGRLCRHIG